MYNRMDYVDMLFVKMSSKAAIPTKATEHSVRLDFYSQYAPLAWSLFLI